MRNNLLDMLSPGDRARVLALGRARHVVAGEEIIRQGTQGDHLFVVESGEFAVVRRIPGDEEQTIGNAAAGTLLGELAVLDRGARAATLRALRASTVRVMEAGAFEAFTLEGGEEGFRVLRTVAASVHHRLAETREAIRARLETGERMRAAAAAEMPDWHSVDEAQRRLLCMLPAFLRLDADDLQELAERMLVCDLPRDAHYESRSEPGEGISVVLRGAMTPQLDTCGSRAGALPAAGPGEFAGYAAALQLGGGTRQLWRTRSPTRLALLPAELFTPACHYGSRLLYALCRSLATSLRRTTGLAMHLGMDWAVALQEEEVSSNT